jgi:hypothetical protein
LRYSTAQKAKISSTLPSPDLVLCHRLVRSLTRKSVESGHQQLHECVVMPVIEARLFEQ